MQPKDDSVRERLLSQLPQPAGLGDYRREVAGIVEKNQRAFRREKIVVQIVWIFCVISAIGFLWFDGNPANTPKGPWLALVMLLVGAIEVLKHASNRSRIDLLKEIKQVQVQILEVHAAQATKRE
jgi:hypothetical protein